ncbi:rod shape-determining protein MreD [Leeuwenhoekiella palythoae]|uniref:Rod shape-determining protein MreD n=1 Tax=Leeuwenhoekiella palythoae TaxID=573501 RepID=A0A1M5ZDD3_9FLAO|nr:rod shape-determining protein MreD [Leeuwenhoekiella palythoae]MEC7782705.1 rod shape-determining protein MreD [Bacteroidota bacterium]MEE3225630.1 rod shape-determining protein MreD [Bacteroidota bacterium]MEE3244630.1 rod shape-determining protein MreD [Bacteroidota bacterium]RXG28004.1 rod shape-determining protein MreD [Leeuwenhoekiella palythoae]SHI22255.1 rod shape-determining protein MreD [Leeuwenhoekiella palythoae]
MNNSVTQNILRFVFLVLVQIAIFNNINFLGYINPYPYVLFIILFPIGDNKALLLALSFLLGISIDMFCNSGGMHAASCVTIAYLRPWILQSIFGLAYEYNAVKVVKAAFGQRLLYTTILVFSHHLLLFFLESFNFSDIIYILKKTLFSGAFTVLLCIILITLFSVKRR